MFSKFRVCATLTLAIATVVSASAADLSVTKAWFRALPSDLPAGGYFSLHNAGGEPAVLVAADSPVCGMVMIHQSVQSSGVSRMNDVPSVTVPAGGTVDFAPGSYHLMCTNPGAAMTPGRRVPVTFVFADHRKIEAVFAVKNAAGK